MAVGRNWKMGSLSPLQDLFVIHFKATVLFIMIKIVNLQ